MLGMEKHRIIPVYRRDPIRPYRDGKAPTQNTAALWSIEVPEEFVGRKLREAMKSAKIERAENEVNEDRDPNRGLVRARPSTTSDDVHT